MRRRQTSDSIAQSGFEGIRPPRDYSPAIYFATPRLQISADCLWVPPRQIAGKRLRIGRRRESVTLKIRQIPDEPQRQLVLLSGLDCLPGQADLFDVDHELTAADSA